MRGFVVAILLLLILSEKAVAQIVQKDILGTWLPISVKNWAGQYSFPVPALLLVFEQEGKGIRKGIGSNLVTTPFSYHLYPDSLEWKFEENTWKTNLPEFKDDLMTIWFDSSHVTDYIRMPQIDSGVEISEFKDALENQTWELTIGSFNEPTSILYQFEDHVLDSGLTDYRLWSHDLGLRSYQSSITQAIRQSWTVSQQGNTLILGIDREFSLFGSFTLLLKSFSDDRMVFSLWDASGEHEAVMKRLHKPTSKQSKKKLKWLTHHKWRFYSEYIPPPEPVDTTQVMDLGIVTDDFEDLYPDRFPDYEYDSTLLVNQKDLDNQSLILDFSTNRTYRIFRNERLLDQGSWQYLFSETVIELKSTRKEDSGDGIYRGSVQIISLDKNEMQLYRHFQSLLSNSHQQSYSQLETYKPDKKSN
ncbi:MAG: hypothetical protein HEP71_17735 [Roseivirga sp.]|nr:hypothetical protein [Roseivirga sp.]